MLHSFNKARFACAVLVLLLTVTAGFVSARDSPLPGGVLTAAAQTSQVLTNTTVTNDLTVLSSSITLGGTLQGQGRVSAGLKPLANTSVVLHVGDLTVAQTQTDENGAYTFSVPVGLSYFPAAVSRGAMVYTVVKLGDPSFSSVPSAAISVPVDLRPLYAITGIIVGAILLGLYFYVRRHRRDATASIVEQEQAADEQVPYPDLASQEHPQSAFIVEPAAADVARREEARTEPPSPSPEGAGEPDVVDQARNLFAHGNDRGAVNALYDAALTTLAVAPEAREPLRTLTTIYELANYGGKPLSKEQQQAAINAFQWIEGGAEPALDLDLVNQARNLFAHGNDRGAVNALYDAALASLAAAHAVALAPHMTHWENYDIIEAAAPEARGPLRTLTTIYELANYGGKPLSKEQQQAAINAFQWIDSHARSLEQSA